MMKEIVDERDDLLKANQILQSLIGNRDKEVDRLRQLLDETVRERENYNGYHQAAVMEIDRLRAALESLTEDPPATLDESDEDWEVILKMRAIAREALAADVGSSGSCGK